MSFSSPEIENGQYQGTQVFQKDDINQQKDDEDGDTYLGTLRSWAGNSSTSGIPNIERSKHIIRIIIWVVLVLGGAGR